MENYSVNIRVIFTVSAQPGYCLRDFVDFFYFAYPKETTMWQNDSSPLSSVVWDDGVVFVRSLPNDEPHSVSKEYTANLTNIVAYSPEDARKKALDILRPAASVPFRCGEPIPSSYWYETETHIIYCEEFETIPRLYSSARYYIDEHNRVIKWDDATVCGEIIKSGNYYLVLPTPDLFTSVDDAAEFLYNRALGNETTDGIIGKTLKENNG